MTTVRKEKALHDLFLVSIWIKGLVGLGQVAAGGLLLAISGQALASFVLRLTAPELSEDPHDWLANLLQTSAQDWSSGTQWFASAYLVIHGLVKLGLVVSLLRRKMWSYPLSIWVLAAFIAYQVYRYTYTHSIWLLLLTALDVFVIALIHHEYRIRKAHGFPH